MVSARHRFAVAEGVVAGNVFVRPAFQYLALQVVERFASMAWSDVKHLADRRPARDLRRLLSPGQSVIELCLWIRAELSDGAVAGVNPSG